MCDQVRWLALGIALGSREHLARLLAEQRPDDWTDRDARRLFEAMRSTRSDVIAALGAVGVMVAGEKRSADAVLDAVLTLAKRARQQGVAERIALAAKAMSPDKFEAYMAQAMADLVDAPSARAGLRRLDDGDC